MQLQEKIAMRLAKLPSCEQVHEAINTAIGTKLDESSDEGHFSAVMEVEGVQWKLVVTDNEIVGTPLRLPKAQKSNKKDGGTLVRGTGVTVRITQVETSGKNADKAPTKRKKNQYQKPETKRRKVVTKSVDVGNTSNQKTLSLEVKLSKVEEKQEKARVETREFLTLLNKRLWRIRKEETNGIRLRIGCKEQETMYNDEDVIEFQGCNECDGVRLASFDVCPTGVGDQVEACACCVRMLTDDAHFDKTRELLRKTMIEMMTTSEGLSGGMSKLLLDGDKPIVVLEDQQLQREQETASGKHAATQRRIENVRQLEGCSRIMFLNGGKDAKLTIDYQVVDGTTVREVHGRAGVRLEKFAEKVMSLNEGTEETTQKLIKPLIQKKDRK